MKVYEAERVGTHNQVNQGKTDDSLGMKRVHILDCFTKLGQNVYILEDESGKKYEKRGHEITVINQAWYI